jgi:hypothetical protein
MCVLARAGPRRKFKSPDFLDLSDPCPFRGGSRRDLRLFQSQPSPSSSRALPDERESNNGTRAKLAQTATFCELYLGGAQLETLPGHRIF